MHTSDLPAPDDTETTDIAPDPAADSAADAADLGDAQLDEIAAAYDKVEAAMTALDADDLDQAEALAASLTETGGADLGAAHDPVEG